KVQTKRHTKAGRTSVTNSVLLSGKLLEDLRGVAGARITFFANGKTAGSAATELSGAFSSKKSLTRTTALRATATVPARGAACVRAFAEFRESLAPLEASGKLRGVLLQYHPRVKKSPEALDELRNAADLLAPLVPLIEFRHRSWMTEEERASTLAFLEAHGL